MINIKKFTEWLSKDLTITNQAQKLITNKLAEYINLNSTEAKIIKPKTKKIVVDKSSQIS